MIKCKGIPVNWCMPGTHSHSYRKIEACFNLSLILFNTALLRKMFVHLTFPVHKKFQCKHKLVKRDFITAEVSSSLQHRANWILAAVEDFIMIT